MKKSCDKKLIGLLFLAIILLSVNYVSAKDIYCDDGSSTSCVHSDFERCATAGKTGCWNFWGKFYIGKNYQ